MKLLTKIAQCYSYEDATEMFYSVFPSIKYGVVGVTLNIAGLGALAEVVFGFKGMTILAFAVLACTELITGIYASIIIRKEKLQSNKLSRFSMKFGVLLITFFCVNSFRNEFAKDSIVGSLFDWLFSAGFFFFTLEYLISILENIATITGKPKSAFVEVIKNKLNILGNSEPPKPPDAK
jgi:hypothetical protein